MKLFSESNLIAIKKGGHGKRLICSPVEIGDIVIYVPCALVTHKEYINIINNGCAIPFNASLNLNKPQQEADKLKVRLL